mmetsp:Transcript_30008/g.70066  ORF Transcript_30008/g.70066 Transcript_30008/m.70066 type:complete len:184 (-) Transcript_30008:92-643(-)
MNLDFSPPSHRPPPDGFSFLSPDSSGGVGRTDVTPQISIGALADAVFLSVKEKGQLNERDLVNLDILYGKTLGTALALLDKRLVQKVVSETGRSLFVVQGSQQDPYVCFTDYCPCHFYNHKVILAQEYLACKHTLAARVGDALGSLNETEVTNQRFCELLAMQAHSTESVGKSPFKPQGRARR